MKQIINLGIDPGLQVSGFSILKNDPVLYKSYLIDFGYLKMSSKQSLPERVGTFYEFFKEKIGQYEVNQISLETPFLGKNVQAFLKLGYLRGILYLLAHNNRLMLREFAPREIKKAIVGYGGAQKDQVATVILKFFPKLAEVGQTYRHDVTDALAIGVCGLWNSGNA